MISKDNLERINQLARKAKSEGLSLKEQKEQKELRQLYIESVRSSFKNQLHSLKVVDKEGNDVTPEKLKQAKKNQAMDRLH